ncbi:Serpin B3 [Clonorchis sinensis]|uniref:Serpin B3 n=2 Tax=Clonorchis sinensis TaxID=79923 RepID=A0A8T1MY14_CLOSI|nr:Serpin B3 [Clonorchis sinensis]GAA32466.2 leukocyte elastase inhibitor [Clonorchis sinensis]
MSAGVDMKNVLCRFAVDLYEKLAKKDGAHLNNIFLSPLSIYTAIAMTMAGSDGNTKQEILRTLHLSDLTATGEQHEHIHAIIHKYFETPTGVELSLANRLFVLQPAKIEAEYSQILQKSYRADTELLTSMPDVESKRKHMNNWVAVNTRDKIKNLIPPGCVSGNTVLALINALYFKGKWHTKFLENRTYPKEFHCSDGKTVEVEMMYVKAGFPYISWDVCDARAIRLPFKDSDWHMLIVLPKEKDGLSKVVDHLRKPGNLEALLKADFSKLEIAVHLPKFKLSEGDPLDAKELLIQCGIHDLFDCAKANLSKMSTNGQLSVSSVLHKCVLEVDEEGATAVAATGAVANCIADRRHPTFVADHPFFISLVCDTMVPVFVGHVAKPENP